MYANQSQRQVNIGCLQDIIELFTINETFEVNAFRRNNMHLQG